MDDIRVKDVELLQQVPHVAGDTMCGIGGERYSSRDWIAVNTA